MFSRTFFSLVLVACTLSATVSAAPINRREVPQEHSHNAILATVNTSLKTNNPDNILDAVFGLLGNKAAAAGLGDIKDPDCLQQATADQAFTNAKAAGDVNGQVAALTYRALERNTAAVGQKSNACTSIKAVNPEIAAIQQHQDAASAGAAASNKAVTLELAKQIKAVGGNPQDALKAGTFAPGNTNDNTGKGNSCDVVDDAEGCIFSQNLLVEDATPQEIDAAVANVKVKRAALNFGTCTNPTVEFAAGLPGRKATEFAFQPVDQAQFNHGSALNPDIIFKFVCDNLVNSCGLKNTDSTVQTCRAAETSADGLGKTGAAADAFNAALGFKTNFAAVQAPAAANGRRAAALNFGTCSNPTVEFAAGLPGRKATEFAFQPADQAQFNHGSALNPDIIFKFVCDNLVNSCGLKNTDSTVQTCRAAETSADGLGKTGAAADAFNAALGFKTNFAAVQAPAAANGRRAAALNFGTCTDPTVKFGAGLDGRKATEFSFIPNNQQDFSHGSALNPDIIFQSICDTLVNKCGLTNADSTVQTCRAAQKTADGFGKTGAAADSFNAALGFKTDFAAIQAPAAANGRRAAALNFGTCTDPTVKFGAGLDGRKATEFSFIPNNQQDFSHGSALNPDIIFQSICDTLVNKCGLTNADSTVQTCRAAQKTADGFGKTGAAADSFNAALGFKTDFAAIQAPAAANGRRAALDFGSCSDPTVKFANGLDGRNEASFEPNNEKDFNHGSALNPGLIFNFICGQLQSSCKASAATVSTCKSAAASAGGIKGGAAADAFNKALGFSTDFAAVKST